jgi:hypothetical protein
MDCRRFREGAEQTWVRALTTTSPELLEQLVDGELSCIGPDGQYEDREAPPGGASRAAITGGHAGAGSSRAETRMNAGGWGREVMLGV